MILHSQSHGELYPELFQSIPLTEICLYPIDGIRKVCQDDRMMEIFTMINI